MSLHLVGMVISSAISFLTQKAVGSVLSKNKLPARIEQVRHVNGELIQQESRGNNDLLRAQIALGGKQLELMQQAEKRNEIALQLQTEIAKRGLELQAKQLEDNRQLGRMYLQTLEKHRRKRNFNSVSRSYKRNMTSGVGRVCLVGQSCNGFLIKTPAC